MKIGFHVISFEIIGVFDSYFIHMYIITNYRSSYPLTIIIVLALHLFRAISFAIIGVLDSYFIHMYIIINYRSGVI